MKEAIAERNRAIYLMARHIPYRTVAREFGISSSRVQQIVAQLGGQSRRVILTPTEADQQRMVSIHASYERLSILVREAGVVVEEIEAQKADMVGHVGDPRLAKLIVNGIRQRLLAKGAALLFTISLTQLSSPS